MKRRMHAAIYAALVLCAIFTSCKKEGNIDEPFVNDAKAGAGNVGAMRTEDRPKQVKGRIKNSLAADVTGADIILEANDYSDLDNCSSGTSGMFLTNEEITSGTYYLYISASGYVSRRVQIVVPENTEYIFDAGNITLESNVIIEP